MSSVDTADTRGAEPGPLSDVHFPVLDTLRAVGAIGVLTTHTAFWAGAYTQHGWLGPMLARLDVGVALFFVLSGFLLSRPWLASAALSGPRPGVARYFWKRALRILPVYLVTATIALALLADNRGLGFRDWLVTLSLTDIYVHARLPAGLTQMWSLATEAAFYVVLPALMFLVVGRGRALRPARVAILVVAMFLLSVLWLGELGARVPGSDQLPVNEWLPAFTSWFAVGIGLALAHTMYVSSPHHARIRRALDVAGSLPGVCWALALALLLVASTSLAGPTLLVPPSGSEAIMKNLLYAGIGGVLVFTGVFASPHSGYARWMSHRVLRRLGHISYALFCIHLPMLHFVMWFTGYDLFQGHFAQIFLLTLVLSVAAAEVLYRAVELPFMRLRNLGRQSPAATTSPDESTTSTR